MSCPHCGAEAPVGSAFCYVCRRRLDAPPAPMHGAANTEAAWTATHAAAHTRPGTVTVIAVLDFLGGLVSLVAAGLLAWAAAANLDSRVALGIGAALVAFTALMYIACGVGLLMLHPLARVLQIALSILSICNLISIPVLVYLLRPGVRLLFSGRTPQAMSPQELQLVERHGRVPGSSVVVLVAVFAMLLVGMVPMIAILSAIAIPALLRARMATNEASAKADTRLLVDAQQSYAQQNAGSYEGRLECLSRPATCLPGSTTSVLPRGTEFSAEVIKQGYERRFIAGPPFYTRMVVPLGPDARPSATSVTSFVYVSIPVNINQTGSLGICGDHTGRVCTTVTPGALRDLDGSACPPEPECTSPY